MQHLFEAVALVGLLAWGMALIATVLYDVHRHPTRALPAPAPHAGMTADGVPWVAGPAPQGGVPGDHQNDRPHQGQLWGLAEAAHAA